MALQVWLPLTKNGDYRNLGLLGPLTVSTTPSFTTGGKLGTYCMSTGNILLSAEQSTKVFSNNTMSYCFWYKPVGTSGSTMIFGSESPTRTFATFLYNSPLGFHGDWRTTSGSSPIVWYYGSLFTQDQWYHITIVYDGSSSTASNHNAKIYINGTLTYTFTGDVNRSDYGHAMTVIAGMSNSRFNDVRLYDNCLDDKSIKRISLGLVGGWLGNEGYVENANNLVNDITSTCYNGANGNYGYSTTSNVLKTTGTFQGRECTKVYPAANGSSFRPYSYIPTFVSSGGSYSLNKALLFDYYSNTATYINPYKLGSGTSTATYTVTNSNGVTRGSGTNNINIPVKTSEWNHIEIIFTGTTSASAEWGYIINGDAVTASDTTYFLYSHVMVEEKDHCVPYCKTTRTGVCHDALSGLHNDLLVNGTVSLSSDTKRYDRSMYFNGSSYLKINDVSAAKPTDAITISCWVKPTGVSSSLMVVGDTESGGCGILISGGSVYGYIYAGGYLLTSSTITAGVWTHVAVTYNKSKAILYINGVNKSEVSGTAAITHNSYNGWMIGGNPTSSHSAANELLTGYVSDVRLYATALSSDDVLELYKLGN